VRLEINEDHIKCRIIERYGNLEADKILKRIEDAIENNVPDDWRFTESPTARFFIVDEESGVKILGLTYRDINRDIVEEIQKNIENTKYIFRNIDKLIDRYIEGLKNPNAKIVHNLRTAYHKGEQGTIGEEKEVFLSIRESLPHTIAIQAKKIAARPNAIVTKDEEIWVRQHLNWLDLSNPNKEYLFFEKLTKAGIDRRFRRVYSYDVKGNIKRIEVDIDCNIDKLCNISIPKGDLSIPGKYRTENYWTLPTYFDRRFIDLDYAERHPEEEPLSPEEVIELFFLKKIMERARERLYR